MQSLQPISVAQSHLDIGQEPVGHEHGFGALQMRVAGHDGVTCGTCLLDQRAGPVCKTASGLLNAVPDVEAQVGGDLLVAAAAGVQLEAQRANALKQIQLDKMMNVFGGCMIAHRSLAGFGGVVDGDCIERIAELCAFALGQDSGCAQGSSMRLAGGYLLIEESPVKHN